MHLLQMTKLVDQFKPHVVVMDPVTNLISVGTQTDVKSMLTRFIDFLKSRQITSLFTSLTSPGRQPRTDRSGVSSLMDTWMVAQGHRGSGRAQPRAHHHQVQGHGPLEPVQGIHADRKRHYIGRRLPRCVRRIDRGGPCGPDSGRRGSALARKKRSRGSTVRSSVSVRCSSRR